MMRKNKNQIGLCLCALLLAGCALKNPFAPDASSSAAAGSATASASASEEAEGPAPGTEAEPAAEIASPPEISGSAGPVGFDPEATPAYVGSPTVEIHENIPFFTEEDLGDALALCAEREGPFQYFTELDALERAGTAVAILSKADMATAEREPIPGIKPSGWHNAKYDWIDGNYVYNRCHLLGYQLTAENGDIRNLITGTRHLNIEGMLPYENRAAYYLRRNQQAHILYRVTPVFSGENLVASGVLMEAVSLEDGGEGLRFCVYCYNVQPGVVIDYLTGETRAG